MALSEILKIQCKVCQKAVQEVSRTKLGKSTIIKLSCGHMNSYAATELEKSVYDSIVFRDGGKPYPYQIEAVKFAERANFNLIIADEQGVGKTIELLSLFKLYFEKLLPAVLTVPSSVKYQWLFEIERILIANDTSEENRRRFLTQVINSSKEIALPGFGIYIVTYDILKNEKMFSLIPEIKTIVLDECQRVKNHLSERAKAVQKIAKRAEYKIPMSGTPIKNNAGEYFTILNLVAPGKFPSYQTYLDDYCDFYNNGWGNKVGGLRDPERFHEDTQDIIIRRVKKDVLPDLPDKVRKFLHVELDPKLNKAYAAALRELDDLFYSDDYNSFSSGAAKIAIMTKMRYITGISKVEQCIDHVTEFLLSTDRQITVFSHHQDVMDKLIMELSKWCKDGGFAEPFKLHSGLNGEERSKLVQRFRDGESRILIASTLASGEGINLQFCSDAVMLERQWNPANEEQAEDRFHRFGQANKVSVTYMIASGTIDEYFTELVESKRAIVASTMDNKSIDWQESSLMNELAEILLTKGRERWKL